MLTLEWRDVNLDARCITVRDLNTKTLTSRVVPASTRLAVALERLYNERPDEGLVFGITDNFSRSWSTACRIAGITGLRFHDLRATFASRLIFAGMQVAEVAKFTGHSNLQTLYALYLRVNGSSVERAACPLDSTNSDVKRRCNVRVARLHPRCNRVTLRATC
jgi:integrase